MTTAMLTHRNPTALTGPTRRRPARRYVPADRSRPPHRRADGGAAVGARVGGTRCAAAVVDARVITRRRATAVAILAGAGLAVLVWAVAIIGSNYAASVAPSPVGTEIVHVRSGESLSSIADRVAPDMPRQAVIDQIVAHNDLSGSGLRAGQALVAPAYH